MAEIASAHVTLIPSFRGGANKIGAQLGGPLDKAGRQGGKRFGGAMSSTLGGMKIFAPLAAAAAAISVGNFVKGAISEARESQKVGAITANVIKTTGAAANVTAGQVGNLATAISNKTGIDDEAIQSASNLLLTFTGVRNEVGKGNDIFNQATQAATDLGAAMGTAPKAAAIQLGKALNDPVKGITALTRVGVSFTAGQKEQIKTMVAAGNTLGAQKIILGELKTEFGGTAAAAATSGEKMSVAFGNFKEQVGTALLPIVDRFATIITTRVLPAVSTFFAQMQSGEGAGGQFVAVLKSIVSAVMSVVKWISANRAAILAYGKVLLRVAAGPIVVVIAAVRAVIAIFRAVKSAALAVASGLRTAWNAVKSATSSAWTAVTGFIRSVWNKIKAIVTGAVTAVKSVLSKAWNVIKTVNQAAWNAVKSVISTAWNGIKSLVSAGVASVRGHINTLSSIASTIGGFFQRAVDAVRSKVSAIVSVVRGIPGAIRGALGNLGSILYNAGQSVIQGFLNGITSAFGRVRSTLSSLTGMLPDWKGPARVDAKILQPSGRTVIGGFVTGLEDEYGSVKSSLQGLTRSLTITGGSVASANVGTTTGAGGGARAGGGLTINGGNFGYTPAEIAAEIDRKTRQRETLAFAGGR